jgi:SAM-dependent methyltransferase
MATDAITKAAADGRCVACGGRALSPHLHVAGQAGPDGLIPTTDRFGQALADIVRCGSCGHMQLERFPTSAVLDEAYGEAASEDYIEEEAGQRETARRVLADIEHFVQPGAIVDLGCWTGYLLDEARRRGWEPRGIEPSEFASGFAREQLDLDVRTQSLSDAQLLAHHYNAAVMGDVIEHLPEPAQALEMIAAALRPGGVVCLLVPDAGSRLARLMGRRWWSVLPTHVQYFTRASLRLLLERHGYQVVRITTAPKVFTVRYYLARIGGFSPAVARVLVGLATRAGVADRLWGPDFRDRMLVIARVPSAGG